MDAWEDGFARVPHAAIEEFGGSPRDHAVLLVLLAILGRVRYSKPGRRGGVVLDVGQAVLGERELGQQLGLDRKVVRTALGKLEARGYIASEAGAAGTVVTIIGWKSTERPQRIHSAEGPPTEPLTGPRSSIANDASQPQNRGATTVDGAHAWARDGASLGPTWGPPGATNEEEKEEDPDRARQDQAPRSSPLGADPDRGLGGDRDRTRLAPLVNRFLAAVNAARVNVASVHNLGPIRPITLMDGGGSAEADLRARLTVSAHPEQDLEHVLAVAIAEAEDSGELRWLSWSLASERAWRARLASTVAEVGRRRPRGRGRGPGSAAPRSDHGTESTDCSEVFG